jgi:hypothetical protein
VITDAARPQVSSRTAEGQPNRARCTVPLHPGTTNAKPRLPNRATPAPAGLPWVRSVRGRPGTARARSFFIRFFRLLLLRTLNISKQMSPPPPFLASFGPSDGHRGTGVTSPNDPLFVVGQTNPHRPAPARTVSIFHRKKSRSSDGGPEHLRHQRLSPPSHRTQCRPPGLGSRRPPRLLRRRSRLRRHGPRRTAHRESNRPLPRKQPDRACPPSWRGRLLPPPVCSPLLAKARTNNLAT